MFYPGIWSLVLSFYKWSPMRRGGTKVFIGLGNYIALFSNPDFLLVLQRTLLFTVLTVVVSFLVGMLLASMVKAVNRGKGVYRILFLLPMMVSPAIIALMWRLMLHPQMGIINYFLELFGLTPVRWLSDPSLTIPVIVTMEVWLRVPFVFIILLAGLQTLPSNLLDAARIDGASSMKLFLYVTIPWLMPVILFVLLFMVIFCLRAFGTIYGLYNGPGPAASGRMVGLYIYEILRNSWEIGLGSSVAYILLLLTFLCAFPILVRLYRQLEE